MQEAIGLDVNLLLFCAWLGTRSIALSRSDIEAASRIVTRWHESVVRPLRSVRQQMKVDYGDEFANLRARVKEIELEAEQIEQAMLFAYAQDIQSSLASADHRDAIARNVNEYIAMMSQPRAVRADRAVAHPRCATLDVNDPRAPIKVAPYLPF